MEAYFAASRRAVPDLHAQVHDMLADGDKVVTRKTFHGTHNGEFMGPPTGNAISVDVINIGRDHDGKFVEHWNVLDTLALMRLSEASRRLRDSEPPAVAGCSDTSQPRKQESIKLDGGDVESLHGRTVPRDRADHQDLSFTTDLSVRAPPRIGPPPRARTTPIRGSCGATAGPPRTPSGAAVRDS